MGAPKEKLNKIGIDAVCEYVSNGDSLMSWCKKNGFAYNTVLNWIDTDEERIAHYAHAREAREVATFESLDDIGDQAVAAESAVTIQGLRLKADNIKWKLARMNAKKYGDKLALGGDSDNPLVTKMVVELVKPKE
jgi:hypothetical protein